MPKNTTEPQEEPKPTLKKASIFSGGSAFGKGRFGGGNFQKGNQFKPSVGRVTQHKG